jgi:hypothetical protein
LEDGDHCTLQFEDGSSVTVKLANPGASVAVRDRSNAVEYLSYVRSVTGAERPRVSERSRTLVHKQLANGPTGAVI